MIVFFLLLSLKAFPLPGYPEQGVIVRFEKGTLVKNQYCFDVVVRINGKILEIKAQDQKLLPDLSWLPWEWLPGSLGSFTPKTVKHPLKTKQKVDFGPGQGIHQEQNEHGYDFVVPEGTPVLAVEKGRVVRIIQTFTSAHQNKERVDENNVVEVLHDDGTLARYSHLKLSSVKTKHCDVVNVGDVLAESGNTGYSAGPHLHVDVIRAKDGKAYATIPLIFE